MLLKRTCLSPGKIFVWRFIFAFDLLVCSTPRPFFLSTLFQPLLSLETPARNSLPENMDERGHEQSLMATRTSGSEDKTPVNMRLASLDIFRGLTVALMILVDHTGGEWPAIAHAPWHGCRLADFVMPFFLFIVGLAIALALKRIPSRGKAVKKVVLRTLKLLFWGILLQGGYSHASDKLTYGVDIKMIRWCGILQRIALSYMIVAFIEIFTRSLERDRSVEGICVFRSYIWHWLIAACFLLIYLAVLYGAYVPDWTFTVLEPNSPDYEKGLTVQCGVRGKLDPPCNAVGYIDRQILGLNHMYRRPMWQRSHACTAKSPYEGPLRSDAPSWCQAPFEPEGILSSISSILSTVVGVHYGHVLLNVKAHSARLKHWVLMGLSLLIVGLVLHFTQAIPMNKQLYTLSYICVTSGAAALVFAATYYIVDVRGLKLIFLPLGWIGMNAMLVYVMVAEGIFAGFINGWYYNDPHNTLISWIRKHLFIQVWHSKRVGVLLYVLVAEIMFWGLVTGILHRFRIYWKL